MNRSPSITGIARTPLASIVLSAASPSVSAATVCVAGTASWIAVVSVQRRLQFDLPPFALGREQQEPADQHEPDAAAEARHERVEHAVRDQEPGEKHADAARRASSRASWSCVIPQTIDCSTRPPSIGYAGQQVEHADDRVGRCEIAQHQPAAASSSRLERHGRAGPSRARCWSAGRPTRPMPRCRGDVGSCVSCDAPPKMKRRISFTGMP